jgi:hypothetical protein
MRRSPRNLRIACNHAGLTHFGGVYFFHEFLRVLQFRHFLARQLVYPRRNHRYTVPQMILALVYPIVLGLDRIETASIPTFQRHVPVPDRPAELSRSADLAPLLTPSAAPVVGTAPSRQRSTAAECDSPARAPLPPYLRSRQYGGDGLRTPRRRRGRLQSPLSR